MSYAYVTDLVNALLGTRLHLPIPLFGTIVVIAVGAATTLVRREVERHELSGSLPRFTSRIVVADLAFVSVVAGSVGARVFHMDPIVTKGVARVRSGVICGTASIDRWRRSVLIRTG